jgi:hypothetical protein
MHVNHGDLVDSPARHRRLQGPFEERKKVINKLMLLTATFLLVGHASAHPQGDHAGRHHRLIMSAHAQLRGHGGSFYDRAPVYAPPVVGPGYYDDDPGLEGRTGG